MLNVLVVDDEAVLRRLLCRAIEREGVSAAEDGSAEDALQMASQDPPQVAFCDVDLGPGRPDGFWLASELNRLYPDGRGDEHVERPGRCGRRRRPGRCTGLPD